MDNLVATIRKLRIQIQKNEDYIVYLEKVIITRDDEIDILRIQVNDLKIRLQKTEADAQSNDKNISVLELQLSEMSNELLSLQHRIQKLRETMTLDLLHLPATNIPVFNLITDVRTNILLLANSARGDNTLLKNEINNFQTQTELKLTQIQDGCYTFENEVTQLRQENINLRDINRNQQELTNELGTLNETLKEQIDELSEKNETIQTELDKKTRLYGQAQDRLDECRDECYQIRESLESAHEDIAESEFAYDELKQKLRILELTYIAWQVRHLRQHLDFEFGRQLSNHIVLVYEYICYLNVYVLPKSQIIWDLGRQNAQITSIWDLGFGISAKNTNYNLGFGIWDFARTAWRNQRDRNQNIIRELRNCQNQLQQCRADKGLLEYNRDWLFDRYYNKFKDRKTSHIKWKNRARNFEQLINNLNQQILVLQNNLLINSPQIQISNMIGNELPLFKGKAGEDSSDWILEIKRFVIACRINITAGAGGVAGRAEAYNLAISCIVGETKTWYENEIKGRNWQCDNILDGTGTNILTLFRAVNNGALTGINANQFRGEALVVRNNAGGDNTITGANEDWSIAGGHPAPVGTISQANYANAAAGNSIVAPEITLGQFLYCLENLYPTVETQKNLLFFGQIVQGVYFKNILAGAGGVAGRAEAYNLAISCIVGETKTWYENEIKGRNWQCDNILDGTGTNILTLFRAVNNGALTGINANQFRGEALVVRNNAGGDNTITGANEDWSIAGGHPAPVGTISQANYANAAAGNSIVAPEITLGQFLYCLENLYPTVETQKNLLFFGQIVQGGMSILEYNAKISKLGKLARLVEPQMREQYIRGLNPMNQYNIHMMAKYHDTSPIRNTHT
ncbi:hypothetical protein Glove_105g9 [Diversispora epigaea]|uniref:Uncharacterized protein n=1 Tax=Diversispora epigaea TaxID=1348612 RepID=A0A397J7H8_9GLOM|nr:hypothetical protein Glove_105g9 [Diversispora epigaea]